MGATSLAGVSLSGVTNVLTKKYQKKLSKVTKLTSAIAIFEMSVSKALNNGNIDEEEFKMLQMLYFKTLNDLSYINHKMGAENKN